MKLLALVSLLCLVRCGSKEMVVEPSLQSYADKVMSWCEPDNMCRYHSKLESIKFGKLKNDAVGLCSTYRVGSHISSRTVTIDRTFWEYSSEADRLEVMAHELAHCNWDAEHEASGLMIAVDGFQGTEEKVRAAFVDWYFRVVKRQKTSPVEMDM